MALRDLIYFVLIIYNRNTFMSNFTSDLHIQKIILQIKEDLRKWSEIMSNRCETNFENKIYPRDVSNP